jgi:hypothetical protein
MEMVKCSYLNRAAHSRESSNPLSNAKDVNWRLERELGSSRFGSSVSRLGGVAN